MTEFFLIAAVIAIPIAYLWGHANGYGKAIDEVSGRVRTLQDLLKWR